MKTDRSQDKYNEIFQELRDEKMKWDFEDFLAEAEKEEQPVIKISEKKIASFPKFYWLAASLVLLASVGAFFKFIQPSSIQEQNDLVKNEIIKQKDDFGNGNEFVAIHTNDSVNVASDSLVTDSAYISSDEDLIDKILPKRGRIKRNTRPVFVQNDTQVKSAKKNTETASNYESSYVIINGQKIESEEEAIDLAKYSFRILSENVTKTIAQTEALHNLNDYE
ncbi:hypothetical protein [Chryseobacterium sp. HSC-36S06]|uniref:hypothetical protein n=1 Tax=Chryseobacterium sp. HSC-36S06 TaxID=2910970 RepID=UPI00209E3C04|nr:hypothetical protein [Chryseobacterium sp. HSC-36S06]MCP2039066.1 hypothetical protein [Chryseobacterium sp. HSC-36S06]